MDNLKKTIPIYFRGSKVKLAALEKEDVPFVTKWINNEEINYYNGSRFPSSLDEQYTWYEKIKNDKTKKKLVIYTKENKRAGMVTLFNIDHRSQKAEIGVYISSEYQGKGYAKESLKLLVNFAFQELNMHKIFASILSFNTMSLKLFESVGFKREYTKREEAFTNGNFSDIEILSLFKRDLYK
jgi:RimJ/RimL family protein N-acetyltransferase